MHDDRCDIELVKELFRAWLSTYTSDLQKPLEILPYQVVGIREFHKRFKDKEISPAEFGLIVDLIMGY